MRFTCPFVLASGSPRRRVLLARLGVPFDVEPSTVEEHHDGTASPDELVESLSLEKARDVAARRRDALVLGADTVVVLDGRILGKPDGAREAEDMLSLLSGRTHRVYTGIALVHSPSGRSVTAHSATDVTFGTLEPDEIARYVASGSPLDKAGAYGIQDDSGALFIDGIRGDFHTVVGLPLRLLYRTVRREFSDLLVI